LELLQKLQSVAATPKTIEKILALGYEVAAEKGTNKETQEVVKSSWVSVRLEGLEPPTF